MTKYILSFHFTFYFKIHLTKKVLNETELVIQRVFEALQMLKDQPINKRYFDEISNISKSFSNRKVFKNISFINPKVVVQLK